MRLSNNKNRIVLLLMIIPIIDNATNKNEFVAILKAMVWFLAAKVAHSSRLLASTAVSVSFSTAATSIFVLQPPC